MTTSQEIRQKTNPDLLASTGQAYLVGEEVYLRPPVPADAEYGSAWSANAFPRSPEQARRRLTDEPDSSGRANLLIVRRRDDRPVGECSVDYRGFPHHAVSVHVDPLYGERAVAWKAEALAMVVPWIVDDQELPKAGVMVPARETPVVEALDAIGARVSARFREKLAVPGGGRDDELIYEYLHPGWVERLGDPAGATFPRTGTGEPRPVTPPVAPAGDPPTNALRVGPRVYLRPPQESDARVLAHWSTREIDASWDNGRYPVSIGGANRWFEGFQKPTPPEIIDLAVCLRENDEFIGLVGVLDVDYRHRFGESASMMLNPAYREAGYGSEAKHLLFDYVFNTVGLHALQSYVMFENPRSAAALRKQGYREAGREHWVEFRDGSFVSFVCFDLLASDWRAMPRYDAITP